MWPGREVNHTHSMHGCYWSGDLQQKTVHPLCFCLVLTSSLTNSGICPFIIRVIHQRLLVVHAPFSNLMSVCWEVKSVSNVESSVCFRDVTCMHCFEMMWCHESMHTWFWLRWTATWNVNRSTPTDWHDLIILILNNKFILLLHLVPDY